VGLRAGANRRRDGDRESRKDRTLARQGAVRRSQLITTYGVGAMLAIGDQSFIVSGLDGWRVPEKYDLSEFRLQQRLGVGGFHLPPASDPPAGDGVRVRRFPDIYSCPGLEADLKNGCEHNLRRFRDFNSRRGKNECAACGGALTPSRFVVACENGHLEDFPYWEWVHHKRSPMATGSGDKHQLSIHTTGRSASLRSIIIKCSCGKEASLEGAFRRTAMRDIGVSCRGGRPWLGRDGRQGGCSLVPRALQRGSSAAWFPIVRSALSIPPFSEELHQRVLPHYPIWRTAPDEIIAMQAEQLGLLRGLYEASDVIRAVRDYRDYEKGGRPDPSVITGFEPADVLRAEEYQHLRREVHTESFECEAPIPDLEAPTPPGIAQTMLVKRLREVRALQTFTRVEPPMESDTKDRLAALNLGDVRWLPGIEVIGEGVFLRLENDALRAWESAAGPHSPKFRADRIRQHHNDQLRQRAGGRTPPESEVSARFVLLHTLAHALINEWSLDAGYPAAALRERLYVSPNPGKEMAGVLIYTATSDSAGSLGGLISQAEPRSLRDTLSSALRRVSWCSADPLCMESEARGVDSLNLAACHACVLLPESSCETNNCFLDRAMLIGTPDGLTEGFFSKAL
jgi:hypothetical protein